jgi:hypothetical protein
MSDRAGQGDVPKRRRTMNPVELVWKPVFLNDHLAGSIGALQMLDDLIETHQGKPLDETARQIFTAESD